MSFRSTRMRLIYNFAATERGDVWAEEQSDWEAGEDFSVG